MERPKPHWLDAAKAQATENELRLWQALEEVEDPEYPVSVVDMGLIYGLRLDGRSAHVQLSFTSMGCPCMEFIIGDIRERLLQENNVAFDACRRINSRILVVTLEYLGDIRVG
jgi:metal-sulfur cluster biosynthetic enzyme